MKVFRNICIILVLVIVLTILFSSGGPLGGSIDLLGAAIAAGISQQPYPLKGGAYIVANGQKGSVADLLLSKGWSIVDTSETTQTFEKDEQRICYAQRPVLGGFVLFELAPQ